MSGLSIPAEFIKAGRVAAEVRESIKKRSLIGMNILEICDEVENMSRKLGAEPGFPCGVSINSTTAHYSADLDETHTIHEGDVVKLDLGTHVDGYVADTATTISYSPDYDRLTHAAESALREAIKASKEGVPVGHLGKVIEDTAERWGFRTISNLSGHSIERYKVHAGISIPNVWAPAGQTLKEGMVYAIEPFLTLKEGAGYVIDGSAKTIYMLITRKKTGDRKIDSFVDTIWETRKTLPFSPRWYLDQFSKKELKTMLDKLVMKKIMRLYPDLVEARGTCVAQFEHTITPTADGAVILTQT